MARAEYQNNLQNSALRRTTQILRDCLAELEASPAFLIYINDFHLCSSLFEFHLFADDANLFYRHRNLDTLKENINSELINVHSWLYANKLSLNIEKSNFVLFHSRQKKVLTDFELTLNNKSLP